MDLSGTVQYSTVYTTHVGGGVLYQVQKSKTVGFLVVFAKGSQHRGKLVVRRQIYETEIETYISRLTLED